MGVLKNIESYLTTGQDDQNNNNTKDIMSDMRYICKSCSLITEALQNGCDVTQMPNGNIIIMKVKPEIFEYEWDDKKGKLVRVQSGGRIKKNKSAKNKLNNKVAEEKQNDSELEAVS